VGDLGLRPALAPQPDDQGVTLWRHHIVVVMARPDAFVGVVHGARVQLAPCTRWYEVRARALWRQVMTGYKLTPTELVVLHELCNCHDELQSLDRRV
jgi:hypothetical protein